jgi:hypothetical protein
MEIQNISGPDAIPRGANVNYEIKNESAEKEKENTINTDNSRSTDPSRGLSIDTYA